MGFGGGGNSGGSTTLAGLTDVVLAGTAGGDMLQFNGSTNKWNNGTKANLGIWSLINKYSLGASAASWRIDTALPLFDVYKIEGTIKYSAVAAVLSMGINNDAGANYYYETNDMNSAPDNLIVGSGTTSVAFNPSNLGLATDFMQFEAIIVNRTNLNTNGHHGWFHGSLFRLTGNPDRFFGAFKHEQAVDLSEIDLIASAGQIILGSRVVIWGMNYH